MNSHVNQNKTITIIAVVLFFTGIAATIITALLKQDFRTRVYLPRSIH